MNYTGTRYHNPEATLHSPPAPTPGLFTRLSRKIEGPCCRQNNGAAKRIIHALISRVCKMSLYMAKKDFADVIKVQDLEMGRSS